MICAVSVQDHLARNKVMHACRHDAGRCTHLLSILRRLEKRHGHCGLQNAVVTHVCAVADLAAIDRVRGRHVWVLAAFVKLCLSTNATLSQRPTSSKYGNAHARPDIPGLVQRQPPPLSRTATFWQCRITLSSVDVQQLAYCPYHCCDSLKVHIALSWQHFGMRARPPLHTCEGRQRGTWRNASFILMWITSSTFLFDCQLIVQ